MIIKREVVVSSSVSRSPVLGVILGDTLWQPASCLRSCLQTDPTPGPGDYTIRVKRVKVMVSSSVSRSPPSENFRRHSVATSKLSPFSSARSNTWARRLRNKIQKRESDGE